MHTEIPLLEAAYARSVPEIAYRGRRQVVKSTGSSILRRARCAARFICWNEHTQRQQCQQDTRLHTTRHDTTRHDRTRHVKTRYAKPSQNQTDMHTKVPRLGATGSSRAPTRSGTAGSGARARTPRTQGQGLGLAARNAGTRGRLDALAPTHALSTPGISYTAYAVSLCQHWASHSIATPMRGMSGSWPRHALDRAHAGRAESRRPNLAEKSTATRARRRRKSPWPRIRRRPTLQ